MMILASTSPIRKRLLEEAGLAFSSQAPVCDEEALKKDLTHLPLAQQALELAQAKALSLSKTHADAYVIGADQICELKGRALSKPKTLERAIVQLQAMSGKVHHQHSAACIAHQGRIIWGQVDTASLTMKPLSKEEIEAYVALDAPFSAAGSYFFEANGHTLFSHIEGARETILGLPLHPLLTALGREKLF